jgi:OmpA-OmpF porin, OOP family
LPARKWRRRRDINTSREDIHMKVSTLVGAVAALVLCTSASAQVYITASGGPSKFDADCTGIARCDNSGTGFKLLGGYKLGNGFAVEGGFLNFGKGSASDVIDGVPVSATFKASGLGIGGAFQGDLGKDWTMALRLGLAQIKSKLDGRVQLGTQVVPVSDSNSEATLYGGLGIGYRLSKNATIDLSYDFSQAKFADEKANVSMIGVGVSFSF